MASSLVEDFSEKGGISIQAFDLRYWSFDCDSGSTRSTPTRPGKCESRGSWVPWLVIVNNRMRSESV